MIPSSSIFNLKPDGDFEKIANLKTEKLGAIFSYGTFLLDKKQKFLFLICLVVKTTAYFKRMR